MPDLIAIDEAARILDRTVETVRDWTNRGFAPTGIAMYAHRDAVTKIRYYERALILRVKRSLLPTAAISSPPHS